MTQPTPSEPLKPLTAVDAALATIAKYERSDLTARLHQARQRLLDEHVRVLIVGEFKQGKSLLVNALVQARVCPVHDDVTTSVPTVLRYAETPTATVVRTLGGDEEPAGERVDRVTIPIQELSRYVSEIADPDDRKRVTQAEVGLPAELLRTGLELVDTPGVGGLNSVHGAATMAALPSADAVLLVSDASQEYTAPELQFLRQAVRVCPNVACVLTKIDLYPEWRRIGETDRGHLVGERLSTELIPVSAAAGIEAISRGDAALYAESGLPALVGFLRRRVVEQAELLGRRSVVHHVVSVADQLIATLRAEQSAWNDPDSLRELVDGLMAAQRRAAALKERSARWQLTLNDGMTDLNADINHDLRERMREIRVSAEEEIDVGGDPTADWEQITSWVQSQTAAAAAANHLWASERARWLTDQVAGHFSDERDSVLPALRTEASDALETVREMVVREGEPWTLNRKAFAALRGGYIGVLMFGLFSTFAGMAMVNPFSLAAGVMLGGKAVSDERKRIVLRRQTLAKQTVGRYLDDVTFQLNKDSRDMLRGVQRDLRDHFTVRAEQIARSLKEAQQAAERSVTSTKAERQRRLAEIKKDLERLDALRRGVRELLPAGPRRAEIEPQKTPPVLTG